MNLPTCQELLDFLSDYVADELPAETRAAFERHLSLCPNCVNYLDNFRSTIAAAKHSCVDSQIAPLPEELVQTILRIRRQSGD